LKRILVNRDICSGCRACEVACAAHHEGRFGTAAARIHVVKIEPLGIDQPHACRQCVRAPCMSACPVGALSKDERTGAILVDVDVSSATACIGCAACVDACPFGMAALHPERGVAIICDLCSGDPACVKRCATGAIVYADRGAGARARREALTKTAPRIRHSERSEEPSGPTVPTKGRTWASE
jgi:carbon-monoxide dehydrogenase iron sulfur subunit